MLEWSATLPLLFIPAVLIVLVVHELGHLFTARFLGVMPLEFGIGIPPRAGSIYTGRLKLPTTEDFTSATTSESIGTPVWVTVRSQAALELAATRMGLRADCEPKTEPGETVLTGRLIDNHDGAVTIAPMQWSLGWIPIGAFVRLAEGRRGPRALESASYWRQAAILSAGIIANLILPLLALSAATVTASLQQPLYIANPQPGSPAWEAGIRPGDRIRRIDDKRVESLSALTAWDRAPLTQTATITVARRSGAEQVTLQPGAHRQGPGLEIQTGHQRLIRMPAAAASNTLTMYHIIGEELSGWVKGHQTPDLVSPIGAARDTAQVVSDGKVTGWLIVVALISANVGLVNLLPIMPLDGGRLALIAVRAALRERAPGQRLDTVMSYFGMAAILSLTLTLIIKDIATMLSP